MTENSPQQDTSGSISNLDKPGIFRRLLRLIGIKVSYSGSHWHARFLPHFYFVTVTALVIFLVSLGGMTMYSTSASFCKSCHIMKPYYEAWKNSKHKSVACVKCHYPPGSATTILWHKFQALSQVVKYVTRTYSSKPFAEVQDASCLREGCHATRLLQGRVISESGILFDHKPHLENVRQGRQLRCVSCHSQVVVGKHIDVTWDTCYLCHLRGRKKGRSIEPLGGCLGCHVLPDKDFKSGNITYNHKEFLGKHNAPCESCHQDVVQGNGDVPKDRCLTCHNEADKLARYGETEFIHDNHVTKHNTACFHCHESIRHGVAAAGTKSLEYDCSVCHTSTHDLQGDLYRGVGAKDVESMPSPMYLANVDCVACHIVPKQNGHGSEAGTYVGSEAGCTTCHGEEYQGVVDRTHAVMKEASDLLGGNLALIQKALTEQPELKVTLGDLAPAVDRTAHNLEFITQSHAVHNIYYAAQIASRAAEDLTAVAEKLDVEIEDSAELAVVSGSFCATLCHKKVGVKVPPEKITFKGKEMSHVDHLDLDLACTACHVIGKHKDIKLKPDAIKTVCVECHEDGFE